MPTDFIGLFAVLAGARRISPTSSACGRNWKVERMRRFDPDAEPSAWGSFEDAEALRRWSFERRTPEQRLAWLQAALEIAYRSGALKPRRPDGEAPPDPPAS